MNDLMLPQPYLLFLGDVAEEGYAKTALGIRDWASDRCVGEYSLAAARVSTGLPPMNPARAVELGARAMVIGVAPRGGGIAETWIPPLLEALEAGLDLISGMHTPLRNTERIAKAAAGLGRRLIDIRVPPADLPIATGLKRAGKRLLTVGTDCALGKKYTALAIAREMKARGISVDFRATGQTGIIIAGGGIPIDAVVSDFVAGAAELLSPPATPDHWDVVEGQGSVFHPSYAGVSVGLLHGTQPDVIVVCHDPRRTHVLGLPEFQTPSIEDTIELTLMLGRRVNPSIRCGGISLNTAGMHIDEAERVIDGTSARLRLPCADPIRRGESFDRLVNACLA